jgi:phasin family protein
MSTRTTKTASPRTAAETAGTAAQGAGEAQAVGLDMLARGRAQAEAMKEQVENSGQAFFKAYGDLTAFGQANAEALFRSGSIVAKGAEEMGKEVIAFTQASLESGVATGKAMMSVKTLRELVDLQTEYARNSFGGMVAESTRLSEMSVKVANEALEPIGARVNAAVEKFGKPVSA